MVSRWEKTSTNIQKFGSGNRFEAAETAGEAGAESEAPEVTPPPKTAELIFPMKDPFMPWTNKASRPQTNCEK